MDMELAEKKPIIVSASGGMGKAVSTALASKGVTWVLWAEKKHLLQVCNHLFYASLALVALSGVRASRCREFSGSACRIILPAKAHTHRLLHQRVVHHCLYLCRITGALHLRHKTIDSFALLTSTGAFGNFQRFGRFPWLRGLSVLLRR